GWGKLLGTIGRNGVKATARALAKNGAEEAAESGLRAFLKLLKGYGINVLGEGVQGAAQEAVTIGNERIQTAEEGLERSASWGEDFARVGESFVGGAKIAAMMGIPTLAGTTLAQRAI